MKTLISATAIRLLIPLFVLFSLFLLFRGHNEPGGGFIGGLIASLIFVFHAMVFGPETTAQQYRINPPRLIAVGLALATLSALLPMLTGQPFMTALWGDVYLPIFGKPGTPILFDIGVYVLVIGVVLKIALTVSRL